MDDNIIEEKEEDKVIGKFGLGNKLFKEKDYEGVQ